MQPPGNTPLPPLPGPGGTTQTGAPGVNPWATRPPPPSPPPPGPYPTLGVGAPAPVDRAPRWLIGLAGLILLALVGGAAYVVLEGGRTFPSEWDPRVEPIARWVAEERSLDFDHPVEVRFLDEEDYRAASSSGDAVTDDAAAEEGAELDDAVAQLRALGLLEGDLDLDEATDTLMDAGTLAFYDPSAKVVVARGEEMTPALRATIAHELVHVLQDQHFDLARIGDLPSGEATVLRAIAEGDAGRIEQRYVADELTADERRDYEDESLAAGEEAGAVIDEDVPPVLTALFASPYIFGPELVAYLEATGGDDAINDALADPPSEAVLFNPLVTGTDAAEVDRLELDLPDGTEELDDGNFGATSWYLVLASRLDPAVALAATDGIAADGYLMYRQADQVCVRAHATGMAPNDTTELDDALTRWVDQSPEGTADVETVDGEVRFESCDPGADATGAGEVSVELLALPVARTQIYNAASEGGVAGEAARCYAQDVIGSLSLDQLLGEAPTPEVEDAIADAQRRCF